MDFDEEICLIRAKKLLKYKDNNSYLRYACLELRYCIESISYNKLKTYLNRLPPSVVEKWQPPQAMKALFELEPLATEGFELFVAPESSSEILSGDWICLGNHKTFNLRWLRKTYNKLGSFLHTPSLKQNNKRQSINDEEIRRYLEKVVGYLSPIVERTMDASLCLTEIFQCKKCNAPIIVNSESLKFRKSLECLDPNCRAEHEIKYKNGNYFINLTTSTFKCLKCNSDMPIENRNLTIGLEFKCKNCGTHHEIISHKWCYCVKKR